MPSFPLPDNYFDGASNITQAGGAPENLLPRILNELNSRVYSNSTRPAADLFPAGTRIWNASDNAPNFSDGTNWRDAVGNLT